MLENSLIVANPYSGNGYVRHNSDSWCESFTSAGADYKSCDSVIEMEKALEQGLDRGTTVFGVVGGDGTFGLAMSFLFNRVDNPSKITLLRIPGGSSDYTARALGIPKSIDEAVGLFAQGQTETFDLLRIRCEGQTQKTVYGLLSSIGFTALAAHSRNTTQRNSPQRYYCSRAMRRGKALTDYLRSVFISSLPGFENLEMKVTVNGNTICRRFFDVYVALYDQVGFGFSPAYHARHRPKGQAAVMFYDMHWAWILPQVWPLIWYGYGMVCKKPMIEFSDKVAIEAPACALLQLEGDAVILPEQKSMIDRILRNKASRTNGTITYHVEVLRDGLNTIPGPDHRLEAHLKAV